LGRKDATRNFKDLSGLGFRDVLLKPGEEVFFWKDLNPPKEAGGKEKDVWKKSRGVLLPYKKRKNTHAELTGSEGKKKWWVRASEGKDPEAKIS